MKRPSSACLPVLACVFAVLLVAPLEAAAWRSTGPEGGFITLLHRPYDDSQTLVAGTYGGGLFYSEDGGASWSDITHRMQHQVLVDMVSTRQGIFRSWVATAEGVVYRTTDLTVGWDFASAGLGTGFGLPQLTGLALDPNDSEKLAATALEGLWLTDTGGRTWEDSLYILEAEPFTDVEITDRLPLRHYAVSRDAVWRSDDERFFFPLQVGLPVDRAMDLEIWPGSVDTLLVAYLDSGLYLSENGKTFRFLGPASSQSNSPLLRKVEVAPDTGEIFVCSERALHYTDDLGASWNVLQEAGLQYPEYWCLAPMDVPQRDFLVGTFGRGLLRTRLDGPWQPQNTGLIASWVEDLAVQGQVVFAATRNGRLHRSLDGAETWEDVTGPLQSLGINSVLPSPDGSRWLVGTLEGIWYSDDDGASWSRPLQGYPGQSRVLKLLEVPSDDGVLVYAGTTEGVYLSQDFGREWKLVESLPQTSLLFRTAGVDPLGHVWWGSVWGGFYRAKPGGSFELVDLGGGGPQAGVRALAFDPQSPEILYWASRTQLFRWSPEGGSRVIGERLPETEARELLVLPDGRLVVVLGEEGLFVSDSEGDDWEDWNEGLLPSLPRTVAFRGGASPALLTGTFAKGVFVRDIYLDGGPIPRAPRRLGRVASHPNPFNPRTVVSFELERPGQARVEVFDLRGRRVALLHQGPLPSGEIELRWDARDTEGRSLASGVYHVRIEVDGESRSLPVTLLR